VLAAPFGAVSPWQYSYSKIALDPDFLKIFHCNIGAKSVQQQTGDVRLKERNGGGNEEDCY